MISVALEGVTLHLRIPFGGIDLAKANAIPQRQWDDNNKIWKARASLSNMKYIRVAWPDADWSLAASHAFKDAEEREQMRAAVLTAKAGDMSSLLSKLDDAPFKRPPRDHQKKALLLGRDMPVFAYLMDQGTGKTKTVLDDAAHNYRADRIDAMIVLAPNSVKTNWVSWTSKRDGDVEEMDAVDKDMAPDVPVIKGVWASNVNAAERLLWKRFEEAINERMTELIVLAVNYEALLVDRFFEFLKQFVKRFRTMIVCDESTRIKTPGARRTKRAKLLRASCPLARIMSGTPLIKSPLDGYSQFSFLDPDILGYGTFTSFKARYAIYDNDKRKVLFYTNMDELADKIAACSYRVLKSECLDLPPKIFSKRYVYMAPEQEAAYKDMQKKAMATLYDPAGNLKTRVQAPNILVQLLRLQQITSGYLPILTEDGQVTGEIVRLVPPDRNPKFSEALHVLEESGDNKIILWSRFVPEIEDFLAFAREQGYPLLPYYGKTTTRDRETYKRLFQTAPVAECKGLVGNPEAGGIGLDFYAGNTVVYLSNSFDTEDRIQSEDRTHRDGSQRHESVLYYDLVVPNTVDVKIIKVLRANKSLADEVMKDGPKDWI